MKIKEKDQEVLLQVLLMLTDKTYYPESMAPFIGGGAHGELYPVGEPMVPCLTLWRTDKGKVMGRAFDNYIHQRIDITETESICIFKHKSMYTNETVLVLAAWAHDFYEQKYKNYEAKNETESIPN